MMESKKRFTYLVAMCCFLLVSMGRADINPTNPISPCKGDLISISELNLMFLDGTTGVLEDLWCYPEMARYRNPSFVDKNGIGSEEGYVCLEVLKLPSESQLDYAKRVREDLASRDAKAKKLYTHLGGDYGYRMSGPVARATSLSASDPNLGFGTGLSALQDAPLNFCSVLMREMMCHIAFPQGVGAPRDRNIRPVCYDSCVNIFHLCNRRQPSKEQLATTYFEPELLDSIQKLSSMGITAPDKSAFGSGFPIKADYYCVLWNWGFGISPIAVPTVTPSTVSSDCVPYSSSTLPPYVTLGLIALSAAFLIC